MRTDANIAGKQALESTDGVPDQRHRDPVTGQYDFDGDYDRLCKCGHSLGVHSNGGFYCGTDPTGHNEPEAKNCKCERFRPSGKRRVRA